MTFPAGPNEVFTEEMSLAASKWSCYGLRHALMTSCVAAADVTGGNDSGVRWLRDRRRKGSFGAQAEVASGTPRLGQDRAGTRGTVCAEGWGSSPAPGRGGRSSNPLPRGSSRRWSHSAHRSLMFLPHLCLKTCSVQK